MADPKPFGNITVRLEREALERLEALEAATRLNRSEITRQCLDAAIRQFERTGKLSFPIEIADVPIGRFEDAQARLGELKGVVDSLHKKNELRDHEVYVMARETDKLRESLAHLQMQNHDLGRINSLLKSRIDELEEELASVRSSLEDDDMPGK